MQPTLSPGIIVLNKKYFSRDALSAAQVGASSFTFSVLRILLDAKVLSGVILYSRDEDRSQACCETEDDWEGVPVVTVYFHFRMPQPIVASALSTAFDSTMVQRSNKYLPIIYYQTDTLLHFHPHGYQFCVTHHGPFVSHFTQQFSTELAQLAFGGESSKVDILERQQRTGIDRILQDNLGTVLAHSGLQQRVLEKEGVHPSRFKTLRPPIGIPQCQSPVKLHQDVQDFVSGSTILLFTAVARLDYFKNVELLIESGLELLRTGLPARVLVLGDPEGDDARRRALVESIPVESRNHFLVLPRLPKDHLYSLFSAARRNGIFLCPSRYETLGITPLEAAASGVTTLITETPNIEALAFMPSDCQVPQNAYSIASKVEELFRGGILEWAEMTKVHVRSRTSLEGFGRDLLQAWAEMTSSRSESTLPRSQHGKTPSDQRRKPSLKTAYISGSLMEMIRHSPLTPATLLVSP